MLREFIYSFVFITIMTACSPTSPAIDLPATKTPVPVTSPTTTLSPLPSQTPVPTTATPDPAQKILGSETRCVQKRQVKDFTGFANTFLIMGEGGGYDSEYALLDFRDMQRHNLFEDLPVVTSASVSPDQKHILSYHCGFKGAFDCANILGEAGKTLKLIQEDAKNEHWQRTRWLDNEHVLSWTDLPSTPLAVFNPFTGEESNPPVHFQNTFLYPIQTSAITINSSLKTAIYFTKIGKDRLVMMDLEKKSIVAEIPFSFDDDGKTYWEDSWSPDQGEFLVVSPGEHSDNAKNELYLLKTDGTVQQLTHFGDYYPSIKIIEPTWAPDGRYVAFWLKTSTQPNTKYHDMKSHLMLLETASGKIFNLCVDYGRGEPPYPEGERIPVWSLDSQTITVSVDNQTLGNSIVFIDLKDNTVQSVAKKTGYEIPIDWLTQP
jgi:hypothetical protein